METTGQEQVQAPLNAWELPIESAFVRIDPGSGAGLAQLLLRAFHWRPPAPLPAPDLNSLLPLVAADVDARPEFRRFVTARQQLADARQEQARLEAEAAQVAVDEMRVKLEPLRGAELARRLADLGQRKFALREEIARLDRGIGELRAVFAATKKQGQATVHAAAEGVRATHAVAYRSRQEVLADIARVTGPLLDELLAMPVGQADASDLRRAAEKQLLGDEPPAA